MNEGWLCGTSRYLDGKADFKNHALQSLLLFLRLQHCQTAGDFLVH